MVFIDFILNTINISNGLLNLNNQTAKNYKYIIYRIFKKYKLSFKCKKNINQSYMINLLVTFML